jgi:acyl-CoA synthetase (AMP-forming)/AMP-acid ligase II
VIHPYSYYPARAARRWPERTALIDGARRRSYRELDARASQLARALVASGLEPGQRVAIVHENRAEYVEMAIAIARAGGALVPLMGMLTEAEHAFMASESEAHFVVALSPEMLPRVKATAAAAEAEVLSLESAEGAWRRSSTRRGRPDARRA